MKIVITFIFYGLPTLTCLGSLGRATKDRTDFIGATNVAIACVFATTNRTMSMQLSAREILVVGVSLKRWQEF